MTKEINSSKPPIIDSVPGITDDKDLESNQESIVSVERTGYGTPTIGDPSNSAQEIMKNTGEQLKEKREKWEIEHFTGKVAAGGIVEVPQEIKNPNN